MRAQRVLLDHRTCTPHALLIEERARSGRVPRPPPFHVKHHGVGERADRTSQRPTSESVRTIDPLATRGTERGHGKRAERALLDHR